jgi:ribulose-bisphosphate carboxylase large chain
MDSLLATYAIETAQPVERALQELAGEQSAGTFVKVEGETPALLERHGAVVEGWSELVAPSGPTLEGARVPGNGGKLRWVEARIRFPLVNIGSKLPNLLTMVAGNLFELGAFSGVRLLDLELPESFTAQQLGPQFGVPGTRKLAGVWERPLIGTIIKPSVGLTPAETARRVDALAEAGIDFIKDDELIASPPYSPLEDRVAAVMPVIKKWADRTGRQVMYAFNITDTPDAMLRHHDVVQGAGGSCVMLNLIPAGITGIQLLRRQSALPIHGHRSGWGMLTRCHALGMEYPAMEKLWRLAGVDHLHVNGLRNKFCESDDSVLAAARSVQTPLHGKHRAMPVFSSGQTVHQAPDTLTALGNHDLIFLAGGGIAGHPSGPAAGMRSLRQAWEAAQAGVELAAHAKHHPELAEALNFFKA